MLLGMYWVSYLFHFLLFYLAALLFEPQSSYLDQQSAELDYGEIDHKSYIKRFQRDCIPAL